MIRLRHIAYACALSLCLSSAPLPSAAQALDAQAIAAHIQRAQQDAKAGEYAKALRRFEWLLLNDTADAKRSTAYQNTIKDLTEKKPLSFGASANIIPSTNIRRTSSQTQFDLGNTTFTVDEEESGIGLRLSGNAALRHAYRPGRDIAVRINLSAALYDSEDLRAFGQSLSLTHRWLTPGTTYSFAGIATQTLYEDLEDRASPDNWSRGLAFSAQHAFGQGREGFASLSVNERVFDERDFSNGVTSTLSGAYAFPVSKYGKVTFRGSISSANLQEDRFAYEGATLGSSYSHTSQNGLSWSAGYSYALRDYQDVFAGGLPERSDRSSALSIALSHRDLRLKDLTPRLTCTALRQNSNIPLYDYNSIDCAISLQHSF